MLRVAIVVAKKRGSPERRLGEQYNQQVPCQRKSACQQRCKGKGKGKFENKGKGKDKGGNVGVASTASPLAGKGWRARPWPRRRGGGSEKQVKHNSQILAKLVKFMAYSSRKGFMATLQIVNLVISHLA